MFAILFEVLVIQVQEEIHHFAVLGGGGSRGTKIVSKRFVNTMAIPNSSCFVFYLWFRKDKRHLGKKGFERLQLLVILEHILRL